MRVCSGCNHIFPKMHLLLNHRRAFRCGGEWNEKVYFPTHRYTDKGIMIYMARPGARFSPDKPRLDDPTLLRGTEGKFMRDIRKAQRRKNKRHKHRTPGTVRAARLPTGCGFRNNWEG